MEKKFDENLTELEEIVQSLENGDINFEEAIEKYNSAMKLVKLCQDKLNEVQKTVVKLVENGEKKDYK